jgi:predicted alpha/beta-fold hydrolase
LKLNFQVFLWNYRGFGLSSGSPSLSNIKQDAEFIFNYLKDLKRWKKIGVHGHSLGGFPTCYLGE